MNCMLFYMLFWSINMCTIHVFLKFVMHVSDIALSSLKSGFIIISFSFFYSSSELPAHGSMKSKTPVIYISFKAPIFVHICRKDAWQLFPSLQRAKPQALATPSLGERPNASPRGAEGAIRAGTSCRGPNQNWRLPEFFRCGPYYERSPPRF